MSKAKKAEFMKAKVFLGRLQATVKSLPTDEEKRAAESRITALADFLKSLQAAVDSMPTIESVGQVHEALEWLQGLFAKAEANPVLAGLVRAPKTRKSKLPLTEEDRSRARVDLDALKALQVEEIRARLLDEGEYPLTRVRAIAVTLGFGTTEKLSRESLAHRVTTKIANIRGYETLSGKGEGE